MTREEEVAESTVLRFEADADAIIGSCDSLPSGLRIGQKLDFPVVVTGISLYGETYWVSLKPCGDPEVISERLYWSVVFEKSSV